MALHNHLSHKSLISDNTYNVNCIVYFYLFSIFEHMQYRQSLFMFMLAVSLHIQICAKTEIMKDLEF